MVNKLRISTANVPLDPRVSRFQEVVAQNDVIVSVGTNEMEDGEKFLLKVEQDSVGGRSITLPNAIYDGGSAPTPPSGAGQYMLIEYVLDGSWLTALSVVSST